MIDIVPINQITPQDFDISKVKVDKDNISEVRGMIEQIVEESAVMSNITRIRNVSSLVMEKFKENVMLNDYMEHYTFLSADLKATATKIEEMDKQLEKVDNFPPEVQLNMYKTTSLLRKQYTEQLKQWVALSNQAGLDITMKGQPTVEVNNKDSPLMQFFQQNITNNAQRHQNLQTVDIDSNQSDDPFA